MAKTHRRRHSSPTARPNNSSRRKQTKAPFEKRVGSGPVVNGSKTPVPGVRLQKILAAAGYGSRRSCEELILEGRVDVDGRKVTELGVRVDLDKAKVRVDGVAVKSPRKRYFLVNKPPGVVSTARDPWARMRVIDLVDSEDRLFTVGRLDKESSGLILVTNDGELANQLAHPRYGVKKTYMATVTGKPTPEVMAKLRKGVHLAEAVARVESVKLKKAHPSKSTLELVLAEGRNREIRRILARVGHKVVQLKRIGLGPLRLGELPPGAYRELTPTEVRKLRDIGRETSRSKKTTSRRTTSARANSEQSPRTKQQATGHSVNTGRGRQQRFTGSVLGESKRSEKQTSKRSVSSRGHARSANALAGKPAAKKKNRVHKKKR